jgi:hypothetical protein
MITLLAAAGVAHLALAAMNAFLPARIDLGANLAKLSPIVRQMAIVHHAYIVAVLIGFAGLCFFYPAELASGRGLGRALAAGISIFWLARLPIQLFVYDRGLRRKNRMIDLLLLGMVAFMGGVLGLAAIGGLA